MTADLQVFVDKPVNVITCDGRVIVGILKGFDQALNLVLSHSHERIFSATEPVTVNQLGVYLIRGDNVALIGEIEEDLDGEIEYETLKAAPLLPVSH